MQLLNISFLGAGRVAEALCMEFFSAGHKIKKIVSPGKVNGPGLASAVNAAWSDIPGFDDDEDLLIISVPDHLLKEVSGEIRCSENTIVAHTAASFGLEVFRGKPGRHGVFYPLQTFSHGRKINFRELPVFTEASDKKTGALLQSLAESIGCKTYESDTNRRRMLHVAAVFVSNFVNHMLTSGKTLSGKAGFNFEVLRPLIIETVTKALEKGPELSQTGPAIRNDLNTVGKHMDLLSFSPDLAGLYEAITRSIREYYKA
jgi:predicted short-subunit dehydrogenase-like oxidoreductase (DUF2520 family)